MHFAFSSEQRELQTAVRSLLDEICAPDDVRRAADTDDSSAGRDRWRRLGDMGVTGLLAPRELGGLSMTMVDLALVLEETGRACVPEPVVETAAVAVPLLTDLGEAPAAQAWTERILAGAVVTTPATELIPAPATADALLVLTEDAATLTESDDVRLVDQPTVDRSRPVATLGGPADGGTVLARGREAAQHAATARVRGAVGTAAQLLGVGARCLELAVDHAKEREQFGAPIGSFQAVKHLLADALVELEFARPLVYAAAWACAADEGSARRDASIAKVRAAAAATHASRTALQVHGALGYTWEHDLQLFLKRAESLRGAWGTVEEHLTWLEDDVLGGGRRRREST